MVEYDKLLDFLWDAFVEISEKAIHDDLPVSQEIAEHLNILKEIDILLQMINVDSLLRKDVQNELKQRAKDHLESYLLAASQSFLRSGQVSVALALAKECARYDPNRLEARQQILEAMNQLNDRPGMLVEIRDMNKRKMLVNCGDRDFLKFLKELCESAEIERGVLD